MGGIVYAAPDGLMLLSSAGSKIVTEQLFSFAQWQAYFKPESIHAYQQDNQYIAFYKNGDEEGGFIFDVRTGQMICTMFTQPQDTVTYNETSCS